mmetsp:Transcript_62216/g.181670  ORF Transcript_62216/g.181670 Transcript_62216/m.181670 type:complete len:252 (-) Transcript_62216:460-1215(-)
MQGRSRRRPAAAFFLGELSFEWLITCLAPWMNCSWHPCPPSTLRLHLRNVRSLLMSHPLRFSPWVLGSSPGLICTRGGGRRRSAAIGGREPWRRCAAGSTTRPRQQATATSWQRSAARIPPQASGRGPRRLARSCRARRSAPPGAAAGRTRAGSSSPTSARRRGRSSGRARSPPSCWSPASSFPETCCTAKARQASAASPLWSSRATSRAPPRSSPWCLPVRRNSFRPRSWTRGLPQVCIGCASRAQRRKH